MSPARARKILDFGTATTVTIVETRLMLQAFLNILAVLLPLYVVKTIFVKLCLILSRIEISLSPSPQPVASSSSSDVDHDTSRDSDNPVVSSARDDDPTSVDVTYSGPRVPSFPPPRAANGMTTAQRTVNWHERFNFGDGTVTLEVRFTREL